MNLYWKQCNSEELKNMLRDEREDKEEEDYDEVYDEFNDDEDCCPRCRGRGCNYCLMLEH